MIMQTWYLFHTFLADISCMQPKTERQKRVRKQICISSENTGHSKRYVDLLHNPLQYICEQYGHY